MLTSKHPASPPMAAKPTSTIGADAFEPRLDAVSMQTCFVAEDWDVLFGAVKQRLELIVARHSVPPNDLLTFDNSEQVREGVLECVAALDQLHAMVRTELETHRVKKS